MRGTGRFPHFRRVSRQVAVADSVRSYRGISGFGKGGSRGHSAARHRRPVAAHDGALPGGDGDRLADRRDRHRQRRALRHAGLRARGADRDDVPRLHPPRRPGSRPAPGRAVARGRDRLLPRHQALHLRRRQHPHRRHLRRAAARPRRRADPLHLPDRRPDGAARLRRAPRRRGRDRPRPAEQGSGDPRQRVGRAAPRRRRRHLQRVEPAPAGAPRHRLPRRPRRSRRPGRLRLRRRPAGRAVLRAVPVCPRHRGRGRGVRRPAHLDRGGPGGAAGALRVGADGARPLRRAHRRRAGLQRRDRADPGRQRQGRVRRRPCRTSCVRR